MGLQRVREAPFWEVGVYTLWGSVITEKYFMYDNLKIFFDRSSPWDSGDGYLAGGKIRTLSYDAYDEFTKSDRENKHPDSKSYGRMNRRFRSWSQRSGGIRKYLQTGFPIW